MQDISQGREHFWESQARSLENCFLILAAELPLPDKLFQSHSQFFSLFTPILNTLQPPKREKKKATKCLTRAIKVNDMTDISGRLQK
jgi:hypothetical protein